MKLTPAQEALKQEAKEAADVRRSAIQNMEQEIHDLRQRNAEGLRTLDDALAVKMAVARQGGVPLRQLVRDVMEQTGDVATRALIERGRAISGVVVEAVATARADGRFVATENGDVTFRPASADLIPIVAKLGLDAATAPTEATFYVEDGRVLARTPRMTDDGMHPVVALMFASPEMQQALLDHVSRS